MSSQVSEKYKLVHKDKRLDLSTPCIMGILNVTPDSFSDGGEFTQVEVAVRQALSMIEDGADIIDIGGESTRPNAEPVTEEQELMRVVPVVKALRDKSPNIWISVDTSSAKVFEACYRVGADIWNDVRSLTQTDALQTAIRLNVPVILMHMRGTPTTMNRLANYQDVTREVYNELYQHYRRCIDSGVAQQNIMLDLGFGFAKETEHNIELINNMNYFKQFQCPMVIGISRKRFLGDILGGVLQYPPKDRMLIGLSISLQILNKIQIGIFRTHDVKETKQMFIGFQVLNRME